MTRPFADPASPTGIEWGDLLGSLLIVDVLGLKHQVPTVHGVADTVVSANISVVDGPKAGTEYPDALIFPRMLVAACESRVGQKVLGRLGQGQPQPGKSAPWVLIPGTEADTAAALGHIQRATAPAQPQPPQGYPPQQAPYTPPQAPQGPPPQQHPQPQPGYQQQAPAQPGPPPAY